MPRKPLTPCRHPGCNKVSEAKYCDEHARLHHEDRPSSNKRGYNTRWQRESQQFISEHPFCKRCGRAATVVDHIKPHKGDKLLFWNKKNWQSLCKRCHDIKTATEDGGFGNGYQYK